ncbi:Crp/Fnr family transcriptional regulator [Terrimonas sp. NA20]|uniref:Crp/Fnr family transcriptional regulator n=1 Tax=Terrimonas ginsenosidimutans TaxID=2908004 RepID=A0ABS9KXG2_9BACT|nr:Crp/Fnr family transcriptional regulator [Terrimonas ginsenosidimutans]MCG2616998.1 Crp/Fnr family transcriptional regulator [Terrimonas ginsenosidimutans]
MYEALFDYITRYSGQTLTEKDQEIIRGAMEPKKLRKKQYFLEEGKVCKYTGFILKGAMRQFSVDDNGTEHILQLTIENWWVVDRQSFMNQTPSRYFIEAWEDTELLLLPRPQLDTILAIPAINAMFWQMSENNHIASQKRLDDTISLNAVSRFENFQKQYPEIMQRFPLHQIASYLGIARETLSRIRRPDAH